MHRLCIDRRRHSSGGEPKERFMIMDLGSAFAVSVARQPGQIAIVEGDRRVSYSDWYCEIKAVGGALRDMGLKPGDHFVAAQAIAALKIDPRRVIVVADGKGEGRAFAELLTATPIAGPAGVDEFSI